MLTRAAAAMIIVLIACSGCAATNVPSPGDAGPSGNEPSATVSASVAATTDDSAPPELQGSWQAIISTGESVTLEFRSAGYTVNRAGAVGSGSISVDGNHIVFASARCELGNGPYEWAIDDGTLTFTPLEPRDPCGNRIIFLEDASYTRVE